MISRKKVEEMIRRRAYEIYKFRMENNMFKIIGTDGKLRDITAEDDWLEAEQEIRHAVGFQHRFNIGGE